jgi:HlyD family secretion protein
MRLLHEEAQARYRMLLKEQPLVEVSERATLRASELEVADDQIEVKRAEANLGRLKMTAPIDGIIIPQPIRRGTEMAEVAVGDELRFGQPFVNIVDTSELIVDAMANQIDVDRLRIGQKARVHIDALPSVVLNAKVIAVGAAATGSRYRPDYVRQIPVRLRLDSTDPRIFPNASASADVIVASEDAPAIVPRHAVFETSDGGARAFVQAGSGWEPRDLVLGPSNHIEVAVLEGLNDGDVVAVENLMAK